MFIDYLYGACDAGAFVDRKTGLRAENYPIRTVINGLESKVQIHRFTQDCGFTPNFDTTSE